MQLTPASFARAVGLRAVGSDDLRAAFDVELTDGSRRPAFVECHGDGVFRLRLGPQTLPDYGLVLSKPVALGTSSGPTGELRFAGGTATLIVRQNPLGFALEQDGATVLRSITDEHFRGWTRLPAFGRDGARWIAAVDLESGEPVYGLGEKFSALNRRGQLLHSHVDDALGVNTSAAYKNVPFCWSPNGWGLFVNTPGDVAHGVGYAEWSHRSYVAVVEDEALDLFIIAADSPAGILARYTDVTGPAPALPAWGLGLWISKAYYATAQEATDTAAALREHDIPCDVLTLDGRAAWEVRTRFDFRWDEARYPDPHAALARMTCWAMQPTMRSASSAACKRWC